MLLPTCGLWRHLSWSIVTVGVPTHLNNSLRMFMALFYHWSLAWRLVIEREVICKSRLCICHWSKAHITLGVASRHSRVQYPMWPASNDLKHTVSSVVRHWMWFFVWLCLCEHIKTTKVLKGTPSAVCTHVYTTHALHTCVLECSVCLEEHLVESQCTTFIIVTCKVYVSTAPKRVVAIIA